MQNFLLYMIYSNANKTNKLGPIAKIMSLTTKYYFVLIDFELPKS